MFDHNVIESIGNVLLERKETIAVAESASAGLLQAALSQATNASHFFQGGITTYNLGQKYKFLSVEPIHAETCDCVSEKVAKEMAENVCSLFASDYGCSITGFATKVPEKNIHELYAYLCIAYKGEMIMNEKFSTDAEGLDAQKNYTGKLLEILKNKLTMEKDNGKKKPEEQETEKDLEKNTSDQNAVQKGYNEKNPVQPQGAFPAESNRTDKKSS